MRPKRCKSCREVFDPERAMQSCCSIPCAIAYSQKTRISKEKTKQAAARKEVRERKEKLKTRADWMKEAQAAVNAYVRARDEKEPCISCGRHHDGQYHAGHYRSVGACPSLRFDLANIHKQCSVCNNHLSGNLIEYRIRLIRKIGQIEVERLEGPQIPKKYSTDELKAIKAEHIRKRKGLANGGATAEEPSRRG